MELRVQAHYTILTSDGDVNLCRAYMPYKLEDVSKWTPTDLHTATAKKAFGEDCETREDFKTLRNASKTTNFACLYNASTPKLCKIPLLSQFSYEEVDNMRTAFYETFPKIINYRLAIRKALLKAGYAKNTFGRRYYASSVNSAHEISNYLVQGSCSDMVKVAMIKIHNYLKENKLNSRMLFSVHDEVVYEIYDGEEYIIKDLQAIQQEATWCKIPMISEIMFTEKTWADKIDWKEDEEMEKVKQLQLDLGDDFDYDYDDDLEEGDLYDDCVGD